MRKALAAAVLVFAVAASSAQAQGVVNFMGRATNTTQIVNVPINTSGPNVVAMTQGRHLDFGLGNVLSGFHLPSFPPVIGQSPYPAPSSFPSTHYPNKFQPVKPIIPGQ
jgi:hypothetical protein